MPPRHPLGRLTKYALASALLLGCRSPRRTEMIPEPAERPLPPASGTPVGFLIDDRERLALRPDQLDRLRAIDRDLSGRDAVLEASERERARPPDRDETGGPREKGGPGGGMGGPGGGMGGPGAGMDGPGGGMGGPRGGMGGPSAMRGGAHRNQRERPDDRSRPPNAGDAPGRMAREREANVRDALGRAFEVLDPEQRAIAQQILEDHGLEVPPSR